MSEITRNTKKHVLFYRVSLPLLFPCSNRIYEFKAPQTRVFGKLSLTIENFLFECVLLGRDRIREAQECIVPRVKTQDICQTTQRNKATPWGVETWHSKSFQRANFLIHLCTEVTGQRTCDSLKRTLHLNCWDSWVCKRNNSRIVRSMYGF